MILVIHGPNLELLGRREPKVYGRVSLAALDRRLHRLARELSLHLDILQTNYEGEMVEALHHARRRYAAVILNPAAFTHTSVAVRDAIEASTVPTIEVHLSNIHSREAFRQQSLTAAVCRGVIAGFGAMSYELALRAAAGASRNGRRGRA